MSIQSPVGTLDIKNATLRVGKLEVSNIQGVDTALNVTRANSVLIYDDQVSTTTFNGFTSSGVRDTGNGYLDVADGYVYWGQKLPNSWVMDFEMDIRSGTNGGPLYANVFSTTNTGGDGYSFTFNDSNNKISLYYDSTLLTETTVSGLFTASEDWQKVVINYERGLIAISLDGSRKFYYKDIERETPYVNGEYVSFSSASTDGRKIRDLRVVNGEKWIYSGESNVVYTQGSVGIGVTDPTVALDVSGTVKATVFDGDGSAITNISSANVGDFASNVVRIENLETSNGHIWSSLASNVTILRGEIDSNLATARTDLQSNVTILRDEIDSNLATARTDLQSNVTILRDEIDSNLATARTDLQSNVTILRDEIDSNLATARTDLQSNVTILRGEIDSNLATARTDLQSNVTILRDTAITFMGTKTFQDDVVLESNLRVQGDLLVANTVNMTVSDPILELGSNNQNTGDVGLVMTRHGASNSNVAIFFDETADTLKLGYTLNGAGDSTLEFDSNALAVSVQGALTATSVSGNGSGLTSLNATNISSGTINKDRLPTTLNNTTIESAGHGTLTISDSSGDNQSITKYTTTSFNWTTGIHGQGGSGGEYKIANGGDLATNTRVTIDTAGQVGIATDSPAYTLDVHGTSNVGALTATSVSGNGSGLTSLNADNLSSGTVPSARLSLAASDIPSLDASKITTGTLTRPISTTTGTFSGDVGIGTTSPGYKLHVNGTSQFEAEMRWDLGTNVSHAGHGTNKDWYIRSGETAGKVILQDNGGNVGIGTNSPASKLYVDNGVLVVEDTSETNKNLLLPDGDGTGVSLNQHLIGNTHVAVAQFVSEQEANTSTIAIINKDRGENTTKNASIGFYNTDTVGTGKYAGKIGFWPVQADALQNEFRVYTTDTSAGYNYPQQRFVINKDGDVGIGTTNPQAKLDTRGDAVFDTGKDDTTLTGLFNYSSTQRAIDTGIAQAASAGSITASTDINPPPGVAGDVIAKYVNSTTTEIFTSQFTAPSLSIITGDVIYFGVWIYAPLEVSVEFFKFGGTNQNTGFTATGNSTWTWYEKTITSTSTTS